MFSIESIGIRSIFGILTLLLMFDASWTPFYVVIALFVLAIVSPWIFPNKMVSKNKHDNKF
jgi:ABC-type bacteriocin/lantibiotic exporter with double-glycine peptidase domain